MAELRIAGTGGNRFRELLPHRPVPPYRGGTEAGTQKSFDEWEPVDLYGNSLQAIYTKDRGVSA